MGYDADLARSVLQSFNSNIEKTLDFLLSNQNRENIEKELKKMVDPSTAANVEEMLKAKKAKELIHNDVPEDDEEYLDFNLDEDALFINKYYSLLS